MKYKTIYADPPWMEHGGGKIKRGADRHYPFRPSPDTRSGAGYTPRLQAIAVVSRAFARPHVMKTKDIMALPVRELIDPEGCHLYLWTTNNYSSEAQMRRIAPRTQCTAGAYPRHGFRRGAGELPDALEVVQAWGFEYVTIITWMKDRQGLGQYYRGMTEHCIFARTKKGLPYKLMDGKRQQGVTGFYAPKGIHSAKPDKVGQRPTNAAHCFQWASVASAEHMLGDGRKEKCAG